MALGRRLAALCGLVALLVPLAAQATASSAVGQLDCEELRYGGVDKTGVRQARPNGACLGLVGEPLGVDLEDDRPAEPSGHGHGLVGVRHRGDLDGR